MTRASKIVLAVILIAVTRPERTRAAVYCGNCSTEWTQVLNKVQMVAAYIRQGEELEMKTRMMADMTRNSNVLPFQVFWPIAADIARLASIVQGGRALAYSMANLDGEFRNRYRGYGYNARTWFTDYRLWSQTSLDTSLGTLRAAGLQGEQLQSEQAVLNQLRLMSQTSDGRLRAVQISNQIAEHAVQQLMKLRQIMLADLQSKQAFQASQIQKEAVEEASTERFFNFGGRTGDGRGFQAAQ